MAPCLSKFPSVCLETIFKQLPLVDLLRSVGLVCKSWYPSQRTELMRRRRLVLVEDEDLFGHKFYRNLINCSYETDLIGRVRAEDGSAWLPLESLCQIKFESLVVPNPVLLFAARISSLGQLLPNITHLTMMFPHCSNQDMPPLICLIGHFSQTLVVLKLQIYYEYRNDGGDEPFDPDRVDQECVHNVMSLFACLGRLGSLRHLRLCLRDFEFRDGDIRPPLSFLSRLSTLALQLDGIEIEYILSSLNQFGGSINSIDLYNLLTLAQVGQLRLQPAKFNVLSVDDAGQYDDMRRLCVRFSSLTILVLLHPSMSMSTLSRCMARLTQLVHLYLWYGLVPRVEEANEEDDAQPQIGQMPSVRMLYLTFESESHHDTERLFISAIFPNVQVIWLDHRIRACPECDIEADGWCYHIQHCEPRLAAQLTECARLARQTFRACAHLHTVALSRILYRQDTIITVDEL